VNNTVSSQTFHETSTNARALLRVLKFYFSMHKYNSQLTIKIQNYCQIPLFESLSIYYCQIPCHVLFTFTMIEHEKRCKTWKVIYNANWKITHSEGIIHVR
jgi:hypothetical protein